MGIRRFLGLKREKESVYINESYAQEGEDCILYRIFENQEHGFFVDIGAHHPFRFSNTYKFYKLGWRGINIDAMPGSMEAFKTARPGDINLEIPVSDTEEECSFFMFNEPALNTFSNEYVKEYNGKGNYKLEKVVSIKTQRLDTILNQYLTAGQNISFLSIDAEGYDYKILLSNDWTKYRPEVVLLECEQELATIENSDIFKFMREKGYEIFAKTVKTYFFKII